LEICNLQGAGFVPEGPHMAHLGGQSRRRLA